MNPLISCIMPIADRHDFIAGSLACFYAQDWQHRELIVIDNGKRDAEEMFAGMPDVIYRRIAPGPKIGALRNLACESARGEYIAHWDSDDWNGPHRLSEQLLVLRQSRRPATGYNVLPFADDRQRRAWVYQGHNGYACGTSLFYVRAFWAGHKFSPGPAYGEDNAFIKQMDGRLISVSRQSIVARIHDNGTSPRDMRTWPEIDYAALAQYGYPIHEVQHEAVVSESVSESAHERYGRDAGSDSGHFPVGSERRTSDETGIRADYRPAYAASGCAPHDGTDSAPRGRRKRRDQGQRDRAGD